jgi:methylglyoxal/glyoxal reductase
MVRIPTLKLNTGAEIPQIGFGLWRNRDANECKQSIRWALEAGHTHFDDAQVYGNEQYLGQALKEAGADRSRLFITTKIAREHMWGNEVIPTFEESLEKLQMDYVDLLLLHWPHTETRDMGWQRLQQLYQDGRAKNIGVSNYTVKHLEEMKRFGVVPVVNQVELSVALQQPELVAYCKAHDIVVEAYTPLAEGLFFDDPILKAIAKKHSKTVPQVMLRWCIDYGTVVLTKSVHQDRIKEGLDILGFQLDDDDMLQIKKLDNGVRTCWNPTNIP